MPMLLLELVLGLFEFVCPQLVKPMIVKNIIKSLFILLSWLIYLVVWENYTHRAGLYAGWEIAFRLPITAAD
jgi:hypothetical protein